MLLWTLINCKLGQVYSDSHQGSVNSAIATYQSYTSTEQNM